MTDLTLLFQSELLLRMLIAGACGMLIGLERRNRGKEAGIRTHIIVTLSSALMMIVSKYGFFDVLLMGVEKGINISLDASRVAAGIISGISFLGAGMIVMQKKSIIGLTTSAGIWASSGIGMAIGAGMYIIGVSGTVMVIFVHIVLHDHLQALQRPEADTIIITAANDKELIDDILARIEKESVQLERVRIDNSQDAVIVKISMFLPSGMKISKLTGVLTGVEKIKSIEII